MAARVWEWFIISEVAKTSRRRKETALRGLVCWTSTDTFQLFEQPNLKHPDESTFRCYAFVTVYTNVYV